MIRELSKNWGIFFIDVREKWYRWHRRTNWTYMPVIQKKLALTSVKKTVTIEMGVSVFVHSPSTVKKTVAIEMGVSVFVQSPSTKPITHFGTTLSFIREKWYNSYRNCSIFTKLSHRHDLLSMVDAIMLHLYPFLVNTRSNCPRFTEHFSNALGKHRIYWNGIHVQ